VAHRIGFALSGERGRLGSFGRESNGRGLSRASCSPQSRETSAEYFGGPCAPKAKTFVLLLLSPNWVRFFEFANCRPPLGRRIFILGFEGAGGGAYAGFVCEQRRSLGSFGRVLNPPRLSPSGSGPLFAQ